jgi:translation initiation factor 5
MQVSKKYVNKDVAQKIHEKALPFITWLKEAEEESEESDEEDIELEFDERAKISKLKVGLFNFTGQGGGGLPYFLYC